MNGAACSIDFLDKGGTALLHNGLVKLRTAAHDVENEREMRPYSDQFMEYPFTLAVQIM